MGCDFLASLSRQRTRKTNKYCADCEVGRAGLGRGLCAWGAHRESTLSSSLTSSTCGCFTKNVTKQHVYSSTRLKTPTAHKRATPSLIFHHTEVTCIAVKTHCCLVPRIIKNTNRRNPSCTTGHASGWYFAHSQHPNTDKHPTNNHVVMATPLESFWPTGTPALKIHSHKTC